MIMIIKINRYKYYFNRGESEKKNLYEKNQ